MTILSSAFRPGVGNSLRASVEKPRFTALAPTELYKLLWRYYLSNQLYDDISHALKENNQPYQDIRELRNPANRVIAFHTAKLWPGALPYALPIRAKNTRIVDPIHQIWRWSNFGPKKQLAARWYSLFGDLFLKVAEKDSDGERRVFIQVLDPRHVTDFITDERGYVQYIRIDVPQTRTDWQRSLLLGDRGRYITKAYTYTEIWTKDTVRIYEHGGSSASGIGDLGNPNNDKNAQEHGLGFVPIVWSPFYDVGDNRGMGAFTHCLSKIDEANRMVTRLHQLLFRNNKVTWALEANMLDATGRPLPAPRLDGFGTTEETQSIELADETLVRLPGMSKLVPLIPSLDYNAALAILNAHMDELRHDLPELGYFDQQAKTHMSGNLLRTALADAIDRVVEARGNGESAIARANAIALTIAQRAGLPQFTKQSIGTYAGGDFDHTFAERDVLGIPPDEQAQTVSILVNTGIPLPTALEHVGWQHDAIANVQETQIADLKRQLDIQYQQAEAAAALPLTEEMISKILVPYVQAGVPLETVLPRLGWSAAEVAAMVKQRDKLQADAQQQMADQQAQAVQQQVDIHKTKLETQATVGLQTQQAQAALAQASQSPESGANTQNVPQQGNGQNTPQQGAPQATDASVQKGTSGTQG